MTEPAKTVFIYGIYLTIAGLCFMLIPNILLKLLGIPTTTEPWIYVVGFLLLLVGYFYIQAGRSRDTNFLWWTVHVRLFPIFFFASLAVLGMAPPIIIILGVPCMLGAIWTWTTLRAQEGK